MEETIRDFLVGDQKYWKKCFNIVIKELNDFISPKNIIVKHFYNKNYESEISICEKCMDYLMNIIIQKY